MNIRIRPVHTGLAVVVIFGACALACSATTSQVSGGGEKDAGIAANGGPSGSSMGQGGRASGSGGLGPAGGPYGSTGGDAVARIDITASVLANENVTLAGDSVIKLPPGATTYTGVINGKGTLRLTSADGSCAPRTWIITQQSTFTLPDDRQVEIVTKAGPWPGMGYRLDIAGSNPPALIIDPCVTFQIGTNSTADKNPNIIAVADSKNAATVVNGEINLNNIRNDGLIALASSQFILLGEISGSGSMRQLPDVWGGHSLRGTSSFAGVLALSTGHDFGSDHVSPGLSAAKAIINEGSWLVWSPANNTAKVTQDIYEAAFGGDINFHPIGNGRIVMSGVYSHTDNSPHDSPNLDNPSLSDSSLNFAKVIYRQTMTANGNDASFRGVNIEAGGTVQWGDGTHARFFLPSAPSPAEVNPALGKKNAYVNLHRGGTLAFAYNGPVTLNVGITGGGGGPDKSGLSGTGNVTVMGTAGNDVTFAQPQDYNGTTTIEAGATLRLGSGVPVPLNYITLANGVKSVQHVADYDGDSSLLTAESPRGDPNDKIVNDGRLVVQNTKLAITLSHMSGAGKLVQAGAGMVTVLANTYRGGTSLESGTLLAADETALGTGDVVNDAELLVSRSHVLRVIGNYRQGAQGRLHLAVQSRGPSAQLIVSGRAELGGVLALLPTAGKLRAGQRFAALRATGGITGKFRAAEAAGFELALEQTEDTCYVTVTREKHVPHPAVRVAGL